MESEVKQIRQWYSDTQNGLDNLMYSQYGDDIEYYFELGYAVKGIIPSGYDGWDYTRQYFYKDQTLYSSSEILLSSLSKYSEGLPS